MRLLSLEQDHQLEKNGSILDNRNILTKPEFHLFLLQGACNPVLMRFLVIQKPGLLTSLSRPKCCWTFAPHHGKASGQPTSRIPHFPGSIQPLSSWGWVDPSCIACPRAFTAGKTGSQLHHFKPSGRSFSLRGVTDGPVKLLLLYWWRDERDQSWRSVPDWQLRQQQREKQGKREKQVGKAAEAMRRAQNRILNRWSKIRLLMVFLHLTRKAKRFYKMARCFQPSGPSKKLLQEYMASPRYPALPLYLVQVMGLPTQMRSTVYLHP